MGNFTSKKLVIEKNIIGIVIGFILFLGFAYAQTNEWPGKLEGYYFPVGKDTTFNVSKSESNLLDIDNDAFVVIEGDLVKYRACALDRVEAVVIDPTGNETPKTIFFEVEPKNHPPGQWSWGPWIIRIPYSEIISHNYSISIIIYHNCHPFWKTITRFR